MPLRQWGYAFQNKSSLTTVTLSEGVKVIGSHAFRNSGITSIVIPNSVEALGGFVFYGCNALTSVEIGNGVTQIDVYAFNECANLKTVKIGTGLTTVNNAFTNCPLLDDVTCLAVTHLPQQVEHLAVLRRKLLLRFPFRWAVSVLIKQLMYGKISELSKYIHLHPFIRLQKAVLPCGVVKTAFWLQFRLLLPYRYLAL